MPKADAPANPIDPTRDPHQAAHDFAVAGAQLLADDKCTDVLVLDVRGMSQITDYIILATGTSDRQMRSAVAHLEDLGRERGNPAFRVSVDDRTTWAVADFVHVIAHVFEPAARSHYDLEMLWGDAPRLSWERPDQRRRDMAGLFSSPPAAQSPAPRSNHDSRP